MLEVTLLRQPKSQHCLNTIQHADEIFFVNAVEVIRTGSFDHAVGMLLQEKRET